MSLASFADVMRELNRMTLDLCRDREAREQAAELRQIQARATHRPSYNNRSIDNRKQWIADNTAQLAMYWRDLGVALGTDGNTDDFNDFVLTQHDLILRARNSADQRHRDHVRYQRRMNAELGLHEQSGQPYQGAL